MYLYKIFKCQYHTAIVLIASYVDIDIFSTLYVQLSIIGNTLVNDYFVNLHS